MEREVIIQNLMQNIRSECQKRGIAPETLFRRCGVNTSIMYNLRKGFLLSVDKIAAIAEYCGVSVDYLIGREQRNLMPLVSNQDAYSEKYVQSERHETIRMLCMLPKEMLIDRINGVPCDEISEQWVDRVDIELVNEAIKRYDEPVFADERAEMLKIL